MLSSKKAIESLCYAFEMERSSYLRTIEDMKTKINGLDKSANYTEQITVFRDATIEELESKIEQLEKENLKLSDTHSVEQLAHDTDLAAENDKLKAELQETQTALKKYMASSAGLNAKQKLEYKRLKQNEYQRRWLKNKAKKNK